MRRILIIIMASIVGMSGCSQSSDAGSPACKYVIVIGKDIKYGYLATYLIPVALANAKADTKLASLLEDMQANIMGSTVNNVAANQFFTELNSALIDCGYPVINHS